jgi:hypothetical protein
MALARSTLVPVRLEALPVEARRRWPVLASAEASLWPDRPTFGAHGDAPVPRPGRLSRNLVGLKILVVDDHEGAVELFAAALTACGAVVATATSASEAARLVPEVRPDVVLSDIAMAGEDGYWLAREIRRLPDVGRGHRVRTRAFTGPGTGRGVRRPSAETGRPRGPLPDSGKGGGPLIGSPPAQPMRCAASATAVPSSRGSSGFVK